MIFSNIFYNYLSIKFIFSLVNIVQNSLLVSLKKLLIIIKLFFFLTELQFKFFWDLLLIDYPIFFICLWFFYNIVSILYNNRVFLKEIIISLYNSIYSVTKSFTCASWFERESWDLFGVFYLQNLDLRRILNDYGFYRHPLKKDFSLSGFLEVHIYVFLSLVFYGNVKLGQGFRFFSSVSPWKRSYSLVFYININYIIFLLLNSIF